MPENQVVYDHHGNQYEALIAREDYQGNILRALREITALEHRVVLDLGAGTGRLACLLAPEVEQVYAFDLAPEMLRVGREKLRRSGYSTWEIGVADHRRMPLGHRSADLAISGWSVSYLAVWNPEHGMAELDKWLAEMKRVLRRHGMIILFESLGTGNEEPVRLEHVESTYQWLDANGFQSKWIRTDYKFESLEEAVELSRFFFGDELGEKVKHKNWVILPECTGVWWRNV